MNAKVKPKLIVGLVLLVLVVIFSFQNADIVKVSFLFMKFQVSLALILFATLASGVILGWALSHTWRIRKK